MFVLHPIPRTKLIAHGHSVSVSSLSVCLWTADGKDAAAAAAAIDAVAL